MNIKKVQLNNLNEVMNIIADAKLLLSKDSLQWQQGYPYESTMRQDIENEVLFGAFENEELVGIVALIIGKEENYEKIEGKWLSIASENDLVIHRIAVKNGWYGKKVGKFLMKFAIEYAQENQCASIKIDTHEKNIPMQILCKNSGFSYCGIITLKREEIDNKRLAYEKTINA